MATIRITGASDDLIVIGGDIRDEGAGPGYVELSTGDVFKVTYGDDDDDESGCWNVSHDVESGEVSVEIVRKVAEDDEGYTGHATVKGPIAWVDFWREWPPEDGEVRDRLQERLGDLCGPALRDAYAAAMAALDADADGEERAG